jgi:CBS domain containing-hemolysin-like protein
MVMETLLLLSSLIEHQQTPFVIVAAVMAALLLLVSGFASGSEISYFSLSPNDLAELDTEHSSVDRNIVALREDSERTLATILIANNFVNVTIIMLCNYVFTSLVTFNAPWMEFVCITVILTFLLLLFGEIMPKVMGRQNPLAFCRRTTSGVLFMRKLFWPLENILLRSGSIAEKVVQAESRQLSVDDLEQALELTNKEELLGEQQMLQGIIRFGDETAKEVMTSRQDIVDLNITCSYDDVLKCIVENNYSRIPVYQDNDDNIRGVLYTKNL